jgi:hypothetical protein
MTEESQTYSKRTHNQYHWTCPYAGGKHVQYEGLQPTEKDETHSRQPQTHIIIKKKKTCRT